MDQPTTYEITLRGNVGIRSLRPLVDDFMPIESEPGVTRLVGVIRDSSQMHGLVAHLASMHLELLAITPADAPISTPTTTPNITPTTTPNITPTTTPNITPTTAPNSTPTGTPTGISTKEPRS